MKDWKNWKMTLNDFKQVCEDSGLEVKEFNHNFVRAFFKNELVSLYSRGQIYCYIHPIAFQYANKTMMIDNGESTEVYSASELEENIVQAVCNLKKLFIKIKKYEIEREFK